MNATLPLSYGPTAFFLRIRDGNQAYHVKWSWLACAISGRSSLGSAVSVHHQLDSTISVSVDDNEMRHYTPEEFSKLCARIGQLIELDDEEA